MKHMLSMTHEFSIEDAGSARHKQYKERRLPNRDCQVLGDKYN